MMLYDFPDDIACAIRRACLRAPVRRYRAHFIHTDTGELTASLGRLSGGLYRIGVYDDFFTGPHEGKWAVWSDRCELLGLYASAKTLEAGIVRAINALFDRRKLALTRAALDMEGLREARRAVQRRSTGTGRSELQDSPAAS